MAVSTAVLVVVRRRCVVHDRTSIRIGLEAQAAEAEKREVKAGEHGRMTQADANTDPD